jgi:hypothetical protein
MQHIEQHFSGSDKVRDVVIGMADGLAALIAGDVSLGLLGALRLLRRLTRPRLQP